MDLIQRAETGKPRLAPGCRWATHEGQPVLLFPEGMIRLKGTAQAIMELCDGRRTIQEIASALSQRYRAGDPARIADDVYNLLSSLPQKRIVNFE
jgi:pyrroloquinoline quinone biosynthesis protein D